MEYLGRDCLDSLIVDRDGEPLGHVDGIVLAVGEDTQPRVVTIEVGSVAQARRIGERAGRWAERLSERFGLQRPNPYRIAWRDVTPRERDLRVDAKAADSPLHAWERWLRERVIGRVPGA